ncbi:MAG TPA: nuclease-related domain-containing protein, partial [Roseiflexaceae bacterium]|nr:nuclease-related domain-containing protein [Roseiflexaceae bacterium]
MAVQVWIGEKPEHPNERRAIVALANGLERLDGLYLILANFSVGGRTVDLVIVKQDAIFIIELKHCDGKIFGSVNGPWFVEGANGERKRLNPGRKNPYNQVISYYYSLINFLNDHRAEFLSPQKATSVDFRTCKRLIVIAPTVQEGSRVEIDWKVEYKGLDELPAYLVTERSSEIDLSDEEMLAIPQLLGCTRWGEINALLAGGVMSAWEAAPAAPAPAPTSTSIPATVATPTAPAPTARWAGARRALAPWPVRAGLAALALLIVVLLAFRLQSTPVPAPDQFGSVVVSTSPPAGSDLRQGNADFQESCVYSAFQSV